MEETPAIKIQKDYQSPPNVEAEVPGTHKLREPDAESGQDSTAMSSSEIQITGAEFTLSPVITVTKKEATLTKGDMKLQKVTVTEDIAMEETENGGHRVSREEHSLRQTVRQTSSRTEVINERRIDKRVNEGEMIREEKSQDEKKSKIPIMRLRQAVEKVKKEREAQKSKSRNLPRRSSIPKLKDANKAVKRDSSLKFEPKVDDEFEKIYEETVDNKQKEIDDKLLALPIEDTEKIESKFEEIIQSYDEDEQEKQTVSRVSKIPALRRRGEERSSKLGALVDTVKHKTSVTETKLKDGGFKVTASTIRTKRFSRGNSRDMSKEESKVEVTETIDIKESEDSEVFVRETASKAPIKPKRSIRSVSKQITNDGRKIDIIEATQSTGHGYSEIMDTVTTVKESDTGIKSKKITRVISRELNTDGQDIDINKKIEELKNTRGAETVSVKEFEDGGSRVVTTKTVRENVQVIPVKTRRFVRDVSKEIRNDIDVTGSTKNGSNAETVTVEEFNDGGGRTITTTTTVRESVKIGAPVITETIVRNISREVSTESQILDVKDKNNENTVTIEEITDEDTKKIIKKTVERGNIKIDKPVETVERFTRGISREMGNIRHKDNKEIVTVKEIKDDGSQTVIKKTINTENDTVSSPTKTERISYSTNQQIKDHNVEITNKKEKTAEVTKNVVSHQISREKTVKETDNESTQIAVDTQKETIKADDSKEIIKKETMETEQIVKEGIKIGIPVFTKVTQSFSKGKIQNVEISKTIEWKPADEVRTKSYSRSISEKVTKKELKDTKDWKFDPPTISENTDSIDKTNVPDDIKVNKNETPKDPAIERKIKDTVKDIASRIAIKKVTEYKSEERITNTEKNSYILSKSVDLSLDRDSKESRQFDKKTSLTDPKGKQTKETTTKEETKYSKEINNNETSSTSVTVRNETEYRNLSKQEKDSEAVTILRGNVNRLKNKITNENAVVSKKEAVDEIPKEKSILSKIAMFERLEPNDPYPLKRPPIKCKYVRKETYSEQKPKIVDEILKEQSKADPYGEINKVEIGINYDEVTYINEPVIVKEYWKTEEGSGQNVSTINHVLTGKTTILQTQESINKESLNEEAKILPEIIDFSPNESEIDFSQAIPEPMPTPTEGNENQLEVVTTLPEKLNFDPPQMPETADDVIDKNKIKIIDNEFNYEADVGNTRPGKINLNVWKTQVEVNKTLVDKIDVIRGENLEEISKTLPGNVDIKSYESHVQVSKVLPETIDFKIYEPKFQYTKPLPAKIEPEIKEIQFDIVRFLPEKNDSNNYDTYNTETVMSSRETDFKVHDNRGEFAKAGSEKINEVNIEIAKPLPGKIDFAAKEIELPKILPDKKDYLRPQSSYVESIGNNENEYGEIKPAPGKLNLNLWKNQIEVNKTFVGKNSNNKNKDIEIPKELPGPLYDLKAYDKKVEINKTVQGNFYFNNTENKVEIVKTEADSIENRIEVATILPAKLEVSTSTAENQYEKIQILPEMIDINYNEKQAEVVKTMSDGDEIITNDSQFEAITTLPGKLDFSVKNQVETPGQITEKINFETKLNQNEACHTLPRTIDYDTSEFQVETSITTEDHSYNSATEVPSILPGKIDFNPDENKIEVTKPLPGRLDLKAWESKVEVNKSLVDKKGVVRSGIQIAKTLPGNINFSVYENKIPIPKNLLADSKKLEMPVESAPIESLSDPELVDEQESNVNNNNNTIISKIKRKMYFITKDHSTQNSTNNDVENKVSEEVFSEDNDYERRVEELHSKTYSINEISHQTMNKDKSTKQTVTTLYTSDDIHEKTTEVNEKEVFVESYENVTTNEYELNTDANTNENNTTIEVTNVNIKHTDKDGRSDNEFNYEANKIQNVMSRSAYGAEDFKMPKEDVKRAKSLAELDLGDVINGTVQRMVGRMKSLDFERRDSIKPEKISLKEMPKKLSVWEKIALFEGKASTTRTESTTIRTKVTKKYESPIISEEIYLQKIEELTNAKTRYGRMEEMLYLHLANDMEMPVISLGTALLDKRLLPHIIGAAIDLGYRAIDTAYIYGNEKEIGQAIKAKIDDGTVRREDLFITSKLWSTFHRPDLVEEACRASLNKLGLDYFDLYLIHNPMSFKEGADSIPKIAAVLQYSEYDYLDAWYGMEGLVSKGLAKSIGVSNFNSQQIQRILDKGKLKPMVNQVECHPYLSQQRLDAFCMERNVTLSCFGVLGSKGTPAEYKSSVSPAIDDALVKVMASGLGVSPAQLLVRYQIECGHNVVVKSSSAAHLWDNLQALTFTLDGSQVDALHALNRNKRIFTFAGMGDTHTNYPFKAPF